MQATIKRGTRIFGWGLLAAGVLMSYAGCSRTIGAAWTAVRGESAEGVVTAQRPLGFNSRAVRPSSKDPAEITFTTADGKVVTFHNLVGGSPAPLVKGERVRVLYDADAPEDAVAASTLPWLLLGWGLLGAAGLVVIATGAALLLLGVLPWTREKKLTERNSA